MFHFISLIQICFALFVVVFFLFLLISDFLSNFSRHSCACVWISKAKGLLICDGCYLLSDLDSPIVHKNAPIVEISPKTVSVGDEHRCHSYKRHLVTHYRNPADQITVCVWLCEWLCVIMCVIVCVCKGERDDKQTDWHKETEEKCRSYLPTNLTSHIFWILYFYLTSSLSVCSLPSISAYLLLAINIPGPARSF